jgi:hypothetical protein
MFPDARSVGVPPSTGLRRIEIVEMRGVHRERASGDPQSQQRRIAAGECLLPHSGGEVIGRPVHVRCVDGDGVRHPAPMAASIGLGARVARRSTVLRPLSSGARVARRSTRCPRSARARSTSAAGAHIERCVDLVAGRRRRSAKSRHTTAGGSETLAVRIGATSHVAHVRRPGATTCRMTVVSIDTSRKAGDRPAVYRNLASFRARAANALETSSTARRAIFQEVRRTTRLRRARGTRLYDTDTKEHTNQQR